MAPFPPVLIFCTSPKSTPGTALGGPSPAARSHGGTRGLWVPHQGLGWVPRRGAGVFGALTEGPPRAPQGSRGELLLSLCYNPSANSIVVNIIKARNLKAMDIGGTSGTSSSSCHAGHRCPTPGQG